MGIIEFSFFTIGCCIGSFLNVVIYRLPNDESIIYLRSKCLSCKKKINWFDNIPILSWFILRAKCRFCRNKISFQYPLIEFMTGLLFVLNFYSSPTIFSSAPMGFVIIMGCILSSIFILLSVFDYKYFWLPNFITVSGILLGLVNALIVDLLVDFQDYTFIKYSLSGAILGYLIFKLMSFLGKIIFSKPVLGNGDSKLAAMIGSWLGVNGMLLTIWMAFYTAGLFVVFGLILKKIHRKQKIPFGIFLSVNAFLVWFIGNDTYQQLFTFLKF